MKLQVLLKRKKIRINQLQLNKIKNNQIEVLEEEMEGSEETSIKITINKMKMHKVVGHSDSLEVEVEDSTQIEENKVDLGVQGEGEVQVGDSGILVGEDQVLEIVVIMEVEEEVAMVKEEIMEVVDLEIGVGEVAEALEIEEDMVVEVADLVMVEEAVAEEEVLEEGELLIKEVEDMEEEISEI